MIKKGWEHYSHTADMGIRGFGATKEDAFAQAALAMIATSIDPQTIGCDRQVEIACEGDDDELLFIAWLNHIIYEMDVRKMVFGRFEAAITGRQLTGRIWGEKLDLEKHKPVVEIKGATYSDLKVRQDKNGTWTAQCVVDI
jgi:tRNA nucleotidyltransferase (CCA-adding enzyme)